MAKKILTLDYLKDRVSFDCETGVFFHNHTFGNRFKEGDRADTPGHSRLTGYRLINLLNQKFLAHRLAWFYFYGEMPSGVIDHINGDRSDNRICNLRSVTHKQNMENQRVPSKRNKTGFLGVHKHQDKFRASISVDYKRVHIGLFESAEDAHIAYLEAKRTLHNGCTI